MSNNEWEAGEAAGEPGADPMEMPVRTERLLDPWKAEAVETEDRKKPIPGGEPKCPLCGEGMVRHVEKHPAPRADESPFRVRLVCSSAGCGAWTVYDW